VRGWTHPRIAALVGELILVGLVLLEAVLLHERQMLIWAAVLLALTPVVFWRMRHRVVTTTISREGITINQGSGQQGRTHLPWADASEVYVAGAWQAHSTVRTMANREVALPGLSRAHAAKLADALRAAR